MGILPMRTANPEGSGGRATSGAKPWRKPEFADQLLTQDTTGGSSDYVLWSMGPATVRAVYNVISRRRATQYSTVLKFMQIMAEKGLVRRDAQRRAHVYEAARPREWTQRQLAGDLMERAFSGSAKALLVGALAARKATKAELAELRKLLEEYRKGEE